MNDILEELYYGNINPNGQQKLNKHLLKKISESHNRCRPYLLISGLSVRPNR
jgi:hypothetical protein